MNKPYCGMVPTYNPKSQLVKGWNILGNVTGNRIKTTLVPHIYFNRILQNLIANHEPEMSALDNVILNKHPLEHFRLATNFKLNISMWNTRS